MTQEKIYDEAGFRSFIESRGFTTNYKKDINDNGIDIVAIKDGFAYLIEHKVLSLRDNGAYRFTGDIKGDICALSTPKGNLIFYKGAEVSLTKTARFVDELYS